MCHCETLHFLLCVEGIELTDSLSVPTLSLCVCVCSHDRTKRAETEVAKLGTGMVHHDTLPTNEY